MEENYMKEFNKLRILPRDNLSKHDYIKRYFYQNEMTRKLYDSEEFSDDQLLYITKSVKSILLTRLNVH